MNMVKELTNQATSQSGQERSPVVVEIPERPALAATVHLIGELQEGGFKDRQWFIQRDGQFLQLPELLYRVLEHLNGEHTIEEIAEEVTEATEWIVSPDKLRYILQTKLIPAGLVALNSDNGSIVLGRETKTRLPFGFKGVQLLGPRAIDPFTRVLQYLYKPPLFIPFLILIALVHVWLYFVHGVTSTLHETLYTSGQLLLVFVFMIVAGIFHEFGHASALRYGGGKVRGMGGGLYLVYPMFYTDVTDSYRLGRWARLRTDLGGFYFQLLFAVGALELYAITRQEFLLSFIVLTDLAILAECSPFVRFDGYWVLADLTGIPDLFSLFSQASSLLLSVFSSKGGKKVILKPDEQKGDAQLPPTKRGGSKESQQADMPKKGKERGPFGRRVTSLPALFDSRLPNLKPWVKVVFFCYLIAATFGLPALLFSLLINEPTIVATTWRAMFEQKSVFVSAQSRSDFPAMVLAILQALLIALSLCGTFYILYSILGRRFLGAVWNWSKRTRKHRIAGVLVLVGFIVLVAYFWKPQLLLLLRYCQLLPCH
jgi:putative peptide zinc metalloprotease protein